MQTIEDMLREKRIKVTPQRMAVYAILNESRKHPNVEMIYQQLKPSYPAMSLATVYKTVDVLNKVGLLQQLNVGDGGSRYDAIINPHPHVYCEKCGKVEDVAQFSMDNYSNDAVIKHVQHETGYALSAVQLYFYGKCPNCSE